MEKKDEIITTIKNSEESEVQSNASTDSDRVDFTGIKIDFDELPKRKRVMEPKSSQKTMNVMLGSSAAFVFIILLSFLLLFLP